MDTTSYWQDTARLQRHHPLNAECTVDVVVIGGGITGITAAYLFKQAGHKVALIERGRCGGFDTPHTTAHLTCVTDERLSDLVSKFGKENAQAVWDAGRAAIDQIVTNIRREDIDCEFKWVSGYLHAPITGDHDAAQERKSFEEDVRLANELGFPAKYLDNVPFMNQPGAEFLHQAKFHPLKYLSALLETIPGDGSHVFEDSEVEEVLEKPLAVKAGKHKINCSFVFIATHTPLTGKTNLASALLFQTKLYLYTSYAVSGKIPLNSAPEASFWDTNDPYYYLRVDRQKDFSVAILGGEDHKTGQEKEADHFAKLERQFHKLFPEAKVDHRWSAQVIETPDGLPFMGETSHRQFAATGFSGNGMTFGTLGAMMAVDAFLGRKNPWAKLFDIHRKKIHGGAWEYLKENADYPYYLVRDWLARGENKSLSTVEPGHGKILQLDGKKVAAYRDDAGKLTLCSPVCTHLKCIVEWNGAEKTWDCPCHGSRFAGTGEVLSGPAEEPLEKIKAAAEE